MVRKKLHFWAQISIMYLGISFAIYVLILVIGVLIFLLVRISSINCCKLQKMQISTSKFSHYTIILLLCVNIAQLRGILVLYVTVL